VGVEMETKIDGKVEGVDEPQLKANGDRDAASEPVPSPRAVPEQQNGAAQADVEAAEPIKPLEEEEEERPSPQGALGMVRTSLTELSQRLFAAPHRSPLYPALEMQGTVAKGVNETSAAAASPAAEPEPSEPQHVTTPTDARNDADAATRTEQAPSPRFAPEAEQQDGATQADVEAAEPIEVIEPTEEEEPPPPQGALNKVRNSLTELSQRFFAPTDGGVPPAHGNEPARADGEPEADSKLEA